MEQETRFQNSASGSDSRYLLVAGGLLVVIIVALAWLWLAERTQRRRLADQVQQLQLRQRLAQLIPGMGGPGRQIPPEIARDELPQETVNWNGRARTVLRMAEADAQRLGFQPGDVIVVSEGQAPRPATAASGPSSGPR